MRKLLFFLLISLQAAHAQPFRVPLRLIHVAGTNALTKEEFVTYTADLKNQYKKANIILKIRPIEVENGNTIGNYPYNSSFAYLSFLSLAHDTRGREGFATLVVAPPLRDITVSGLERFFLVGIAHINSYPKGFGFIAAMFKNQYGTPRYFESVNGGAHELGHELGAHHRPDWECTIMDPLIAHCGGDVKEWHPESVKQMRRRLLYVRRKGREGGK